MLNVKGTINYLEKHGANRIIKILDKRETKELREMYKELVNYDLDLNIQNLKKHQIRYAIIQKLKKIQEYYKKNGISY